jgi:hypothetical protein
MRYTRDRNDKPKKKNLFNIRVEGLRRFTHLERYLQLSQEFDQIRDTWRPNTNYKRKDN